MRNTSTFEYITNLQYSIKAAREQIEAFKSGARYTQMEAEFRAIIRERDKIIREQKEELERIRKDFERMTQNWFDVFEDLEKEKAKEIRRMEAALKKMEQRVLETETENNQLKAELKEKRQEIYRIQTELEEEKGKNLKLTAQLNHDYENSSLPSSMVIREKKKKKISNNREKTGMAPGGQPGHPGHSRKRQEPTKVVQLLPPPEVLEDPDFRKTKKTIVRQVVGISVSPIVVEYHADVYYNSKTGERIHAGFPAEARDDVNYDGSIKAFLYLLNTECCVSIDKCSRFLADLTGGKLNISKGMINGIGKEFAKKTEKERKELSRRILMAPVMHTDCTNGRINGETAYVYVCATPCGEVMYYSRPNKGHAGVKGTLTEDYQGILVHDHESTFYSYGSDHQECLAHILRYLKDSIENEPERTWNKEMRLLMQEMIHYRNSLPEDEAIDEQIVAGYEKRYRDVLLKAQKEYEDVPASDYYREGYNLAMRMDKLMHNHLLFLHDRRVPATNNEAERDLRKYKRKQKQAVSFRSSENHEFLCQGMSVLQMLRKNEENFFDRVSRILD